MRILFWSQGRGANQAPPILAGPVITGESLAWWTNTSMINRAVPRSKKP